MTFNPVRATQRLSIDPARGEVQGSAIRRRFSMIITAGLPTGFEAAGELQAAGRGIDAKRGDRIALLIAGVKKCAAGIDARLRGESACTQTSEIIAQLAVVRPPQKSTRHCAVDSTRTETGHRR